MHCNALDVENLQLRPLEQLNERSERKIAKVFVIDRVEFEIVHEVDEIGELENGHAARCEDGLNPGDETLEVRNVRQHVVRVQDIGVLALLAQGAGKPGGEEIANGFDPSLAC